MRPKAEHVSSELPTRAEDWLAGVRDAAASGTLFLRNLVTLMDPTSPSSTHPSTDARGALLDRLTSLLKPIRLSVLEAP